MPLRLRATVWLQLLPLLAPLSCVSLTWSCSKSDATGPMLGSSAAPALASGAAASSTSNSPPTSSVAAVASVASPKAEWPRVLVQGGERVAAANASKVLHFGDSMVPLVGNYLKPRIEKQGGQYEILSTSSSTTLSWAEGAELKQALDEFGPDLVLVSLGSNELFFKDDLEARAKAVRSIVQTIGHRPCLWIAPPSWAKAVRGFLDVLESNLGHCQYFDSTRIEMERQEDGRHPTWGASHRWASLVWADLGGKD